MTWLALTASAVLAAFAALVVTRGGWRGLAWLALGALTFLALVALGAGMPLGSASRWLALGVIGSGLVAISLIDWKTKQVPRELSWSWLVAGAVVALIRFAQVQDVSASAYWVGLYALWQANILGGGDAKLLMGAFGLWSDPALALLVAGVTLARGLGFMLWHYRRRAVARLAQVTSELVSVGVGAAPPVWVAATWGYALAVGLYLIVKSLVC